MSIEQDATIEIQGTRYSPRSAADRLGMLHKTDSPDLQSAMDGLGGQDMFGEKIVGAMLTLWSSTGRTRVADTGSGFGDHLSFRGEESNYGLTLVTE